MPVEKRPFNTLTGLKEDKTNGCEYVVPDEGSIIWVDTMVITRNAPHADDAERFINYLLDPTVGAHLSNYINYATPNAAAMKKINPESRENPRIYPTPETIKKMEYLEDVGQETGLYDEVWTAAKAR